MRPRGQRWLPETRINDPVATGFRPRLQIVQQELGLATSPWRKQHESRGNSGDKEPKVLLGQFGPREVPCVCQVATNSTMCLYSNKLLCMATGRKH